jgi:phosphoribosylglycinamide formyltransferase-1
MRIAVLCSGRGSNLKALLEAYERGQIPGAEFKVVISDTKDAFALNIGREHGMDAIVVPRTAFHANRNGFERRLLEVLSPYAIELVVLAGFQRVLGETFLSAYPMKVMNIHPAILPSFPGHMVWQKEVDYGVKLSGATVHFVDTGVDSGPIILQGAVPVLDTDGADDLSARILTIEHRILPRAVALFCAGRLEVIGRKVTIKDLSPPAKEASNFLIWPPLEG